MPESDPPDPFAALDPQVPVVLLPVRLETRVRRETDPPELLVRLYPEQLHLRTHDPGLTAAELRHGRAFWEHTWRAGSDTAAARRAWRALVTALGARRAAWVSRQLQPENPGDQPEQPVGPGEELPVAPTFPEPPRRGDDDSASARTDVLPDRWVLLGYAGGQRLFTHWCAPVPDPLRVGPDPRPADPEESPVTGGTMRWLVDFGEALAAGMAARIPTTMQRLRQLDTLLAVGVKAGLDPAGAAERLTDLLDGHHYTDGLALLPPGTPTNNTPQATDRASDPDHDRSFASERTGPLFTAGDGSDGDLVTRALALQPEVLAHVPGAGDRSDGDAAAMHTALWATTWRYYLRQLVRTVSDEDIAHARTLFTRHVRGRGPFPTLQVGVQPYGLLPVTSLTRWLPGPDDADTVPVVAMLRRLRPAWRRSAERVPRLPGAARPDRTLLELLTMHPTSVRYAVRSLLGPAYVRHLGSFIGLGLDTTWWQQQEALADRGLADLDLPQAPWLRQGVWDPEPRPLTAAVLQSGPLSGTAPPDPNHPAWLRDRGYLTVRDADPADVPTLLARLLRHGLLLEYAAAARRLLAAHDALPERESVDDELVDIDPDHPTTTVWDLLATVLPPVTGERTIGQFLDDATLRDDRDGDGGRDRDGDGDEPPPHALPAEAADLTAFRTALTRLADTAAARLAHLLPEALDCASHRFDAWLTAVPHQRLSRTRAAGRDGIALAGYGWLAGGQLTADTDDEPAADAGGFVHAPSLGQAATAAVLRGGREAHRGRDDSLAVDLSSRRLRQARALLTGVAHGQSPGALLGYRFERALRENHPELALARFIAPLRRLAPLRPDDAGHADGDGGEGDGGGEGPDGPPREAVAARDVVDGLRLHRRWQRHGLPFGSAGLPQQGTPEHAALEEELAALDGLVDALGDTTVAESVHQLVQGTPERTAGTLAGLAHGDVPPPDVEVGRTPRTGAGVTHRCLVLTGEPDPAPAWPTTGSPRARAEPRLEAWAAGVFGDPARVRCRAGFVSPETGAVVDPPGLRTVTLDELAIAASDVLYAGADAATVRADLVQRVRHLLRRGAPPEVPEDAEVRVLTGSSDDWPPEVVTVDALAEVVATAHGLVAAARPVEPSDLAHPSSEAAAGPQDRGESAPWTDTADLAARADTAVAALQQVRDHLAVADTAAAGALVAAAGFGVEGALPAAVTGEAAPEQAARVRAELDQRLARVRSREEAFDRHAADPDAARAHDTERLSTVFGSTFRALPLVRPREQESVTEAFAAGVPAGGDPLPTQTWLARVSRVRSGPARLAELLSYAESLGSGAAWELLVGQLPRGEGDPWIGGQSPDGVPFPAGRLALTAHAPAPPPADRALAGLHLDEWQETVPDGQETTGVAFGYDQPDAQPPHAILLAVPPDPTAGWSLETIADTLRETVDAARLRAVDPDTLEDIGHYLPAVCLATNVREATVSTRLDDL